LGALRLGDLFVLKAAAAFREIRPWGEKQVHDPIELIRIRNCQKSSPPFHKGGDSMKIFE
jgi:hypothetical protein